MANTDGKQALPVDKATKRTCFVLSPIGSEDSDIRARADFVYELIIDPVLSSKEYDFDVTRADKDPTPGIITNHVISAIHRADLIVADLTGNNPNVFYELGFAHTVKKPVVHLIEEPDSLPFDQAAFRTVFFHRRTTKGYADAREQLAAHVAAVMQQGFEPSNPISAALGLEMIVATGDDRDRVVADMANRIARMEDRQQQQEAFTRAVLMRPGTAAAGNPFLDALHDPSDPFVLPQDSSATAATGITALSGLTTLAGALGARGTPRAIAENERKFREALVRRMSQKKEAPPESQPPKPATKKPPRKES